MDQGLVASQKPDDLEAFCAKTIEEIAEGEHEGQRPEKAASRGSGFLLAERLERVLTGVA